MTISTPALVPVQLKIRTITNTYVGPIQVWILASEGSMFSCMIAMYKNCMEFPFL